MPLQDHFHPPLSLRRHWHSFHNAWATYISSQLNSCLPPGYFAEANVQFGIEIDVAAFEELGGGAGSPSDATTPQPSTAWQPAAPAMTIPFPLLTDTVEILVQQQEAGPILAGAIELVSPANKDRPENRDAFLAKCQSYLQSGVGLVVIDVVTSRRANLHHELMARFPHAVSECLTGDLYAVAYRPVKHAGQPSLDIWPECLEIEKSLPTMPLWLRGGLSLPVELETTYERTRQEQRVGGNGVVK